MIQHSCGGWLVEATEDQLPPPDTRHGREMRAGDYGKIWYCLKCKKLVYC